MAQIRRAVHPFNTAESPPWFRRCSRTPPQLHGAASHQRQRLEHRHSAEQTERHVLDGQVEPFGQQYNVLSMFVPVHSREDYRVSTFTASLYCVAQSKQNRTHGTVVEGKRRLQKDDLDAQEKEKVSSISWHTFALPRCEITEESSET